MGREIRYVPISIEDFAAAAAEQGVPSEVVEMLTYIFGEVLDGRNAHLADGVQRALGREPRDFSDYARDAAATGIWNPAPPAPHDVTRIQTPSTATRARDRGPARPTSRTRALGTPTVDDPTGAERSAGIVLGAAVIAMGLLAGLYYFSAIAVMPALTAADDRTLVDAMQQIADRQSGLLADLPRCSGARRGRPRSGASLRLAQDRTLDRRRPRPLHGDGRRHRRDPPPAQRGPQERR